MGVLVLQRRRKGSEKEFFGFSADRRSAFRVAPAGLISESARPGRVGARGRAAEASRRGAGCGGGGSGGDGDGDGGAGRARGCAAAARLSRAAPSAGSMQLRSVPLCRLSASLALLLGLASAKPGTRPSFVSDKMIATAASVVNACQTQTGVTTADIESVRNGQWPDSMELKCYMYCLWEQFGLIDEKRELSLNGMLTFFQRIPAYRKEVQQAISECKALGQYFASADSCEYAYTFNKCYADRSPRTYYLF